jgi:hypothetical protein
LGQFRADARFTSKADIEATQTDVYFVPRQQNLIKYNVCVIRLSWSGDHFALFGRA